MKTKNAIRPLRSGRPAVGTYGKPPDEDTKIATLGEWMMEGKYRIILEARSHPTGEYLHLVWDIRTPLTPEDRTYFWNEVGPQIDRQLEAYFAQTQNTSAKRRTV